MKASGASGAYVRSDVVSREDAPSVRPSDVGGYGGNTNDPPDGRRSAPSEANPEPEARP